MISTGNFPPSTRENVLTRHKHHVSLATHVAVLYGCQEYLGMSKAVVSCGRDLTCVPDLTAALESAGKLGQVVRSIP